MFDHNINSAENFVRVLESLNMKATAASFKSEFNLNQPGNNKKQENSSFNILNQLCVQINKLAKTKNCKIEQHSDIQKPISKLNREETTKIMDNFIQKLVKRYSDDKEYFNLSRGLNYKNNNSSFGKDDMIVEGVIEDNINLANIYQSKTFQNLMKNFDNKNPIENTPKETKHVQFNDKTVDEEDELPHFGGTAEKNLTYPYIDIDEVMVSDNPKNSFSQNVQSFNPNEKLETKSTVINPNNSFKCEESQMNEDSIFAETEENNNQNVNKLSNIFQANRQLDNIISANFNNNLFSVINTNQDHLDTSSFFQNSHSMTMQQDDSNINNTIDEYVDDDDPGYDLYECEAEFLKETCKKLADQYDFARRASYKSKFTNNENLNKENKIKNANVNINNESMRSIKVKESQHTKTNKSIDCESIYELEEHSIKNQALAKKNTLLLDAKFMQSGDPYYPVQYNNMIYDCFNLKVIVDRERTGFEESKDFKVVINSLIAGRYQVIQYLGSAAFSKAIKCLDIVENKLVCLKIIENNKDYVDQSMDEIKLLNYINANGNCDDKSFLKLYDYFYHKEHLFIVTELLKDNLYEFYKYLNENNMQNYFSLDRLQKIATQVLKCLEFIHGLKLVHCDLKPENILIKSISEVSVKVIDFGSSCFIHDHLSSYIQSRSYRAPEVILGCKYDYKIDIWSLGCILAELYTGNVLFQNDSIQSLLSKIMGIVGPFPDWMLEKGKLVNDYFTKERLIYIEVNETASNTNANAFNSLSKSQIPKHPKQTKRHILVPKRSQLRKRLKTNDEGFYDFVKCLLEIDPNLRLNASEALKHPWLTQTVYS